MEYFTADLHFGCESIFDREGRNETFGSLEEMSKTLVDNINRKCGRKDTLYILGDVACADYNPVKELEAMKCRKVLVVGNHDQRWLHHKSFTKQFENILDIAYIRTLGTRITLSHFPLAEWDGFFKGHWHFYGHVHKTNTGSGRIMGYIPHCYNVGVDVNNWEPVSAAEALARKLMFDKGRNNYPEYKEIFGDRIGGNADLFEEDESGRCIMSYLSGFGEEGNDTGKCQKI